jgi:predicted secreted acid phosphatase
MTKKTKMYVGVAVVAAAAYYFWMQSNKKKETTTVSLVGPVGPQMKKMVGEVGDNYRPFADTTSTGQSKF